MIAAEAILIGIKNEVRGKIASNHIRSTEEALSFIVDHYQLFTYFDVQDPQIGQFFGEIRTLCQAFGLPATDQELLERLIAADQNELAEPPHKNQEDPPPRHHSSAPPERLVLSARHSAS